MKARVPILVAAAALVGGAVLWHRVSQRETGCFAGVEWPMAFDVGIVQVARPLAAPGERFAYRSSSSEFKADLLIAPEGPGAFALRVKPLSWKKDEREQTEFTAFTRDTLLAIDGACRITKITFDGRETFHAREMISRFAMLLDLGVETAATPRAEDAFGVSSYERVVDAAGAVVLSRTAVVEPRRGASPAGELRIAKILRSALKYSGRSDGPWFDSLVGGERLQGAAADGSGAHELDYDIRIARKRAKVDAVATSAIPTRYRVEKRPGEPFRGVDKPSVYDQKAADAPPRTFEEALERFLSLVDTDARTAKFFLIDYLRKNPDAASRLDALIRAEEFDDENLVQVLHAMAKSGVDSTQDVFTALIRDEAVDLSTKLRVIFAVGEVRFPGDALVSSLREHIEELKSTGTGLDDLSSTALLQTGVVAGNLRDVAPEAVAAIAEDLRQIATRPEADAKVRANAIDAIGNAGLDELGTEVLNAAVATQDVERAAAYEALPHLALPGRESLLSTAAGRDESAMARTAAVTSLAAIGIHDPATVPLVKAALGRELKPENRATAVGALAKASARLPEAKAAVLEHLRTEQSTRVFEAAGRYLPASELSALVRRTH